MLSLKRGRLANAVVVADRIYLVDAGNGVGRQLLASGLDVRKVDNIFITHNHDFHNADWGALVVVFSGDSGKCPAMEQFAREADTLFHAVVDLPSIQQMLLRELLPGLAQRASASTWSRTTPPRKTLAGWLRTQA
ncbi:MBL fold metallo-hydrolase [Variovorax rhizosphaerae]|uniref:MBL fold metallo-hydrolase n=1 Tax=Variovorax rhizosphaerae TaxID=1836200 RepID=A0ABU8WRD3_9BURK